MLSQAEARIDRNTLTEEEANIQRHEAIRVVELSIKDKATKLSFIVNPTNGVGFFQILFNLDWQEKGLVVTKDKLQMIASSSIGQNKKKEILGILAGNKETQDSLCMTFDNKGFRKFMSKESYWWHMMETARSILKNLSAGSEELPDEEAYFRRQHFAHAFGDLHTDG
ncbi:hypothetical protein O6H91_18G013900 [Diphasiastrum complanatum]|uniref:Uncharacterized protein n=1 Tax=Diphasiastrum complanatum TaxID=34168 RepID=A0ACC2AY92_DIPCM|nr:hypothetical protein O6H91_18G013900 [Diphasiastrum complanatum]